MVTAISCTIAKCVPKEELPTITAIFGQIASTLATITVQEEANKPPEIVPPDFTPGTDIIVAQANKTVV
jgi:hypothetical protein